MPFPRTWFYWVIPFAFLWLWLPASAAEIPFNQAFTETVPVTSWTEIRDQGIIKQRFDYSCGASPPHPGPLPPGGEGNMRLSVIFP